jgi:hypothetical protein
MKTAIVCLSILLAGVICIALFEGTIIFKQKEQNERLLCVLETLHTKLLENNGFISENTTLRYAPIIIDGKPVVRNGFWQGE